MTRSRRCTIKSYQPTLCQFFFFFLSRVRGTVSGMRKKYYTMTSNAMRWLRPGKPRDVPDRINSGQF